MAGPPRPLFPPGPISGATGSPRRPGRPSPSSIQPPANHAKDMRPSAMPTTLTRRRCRRGHCHVRRLVGTVGRCPREPAVPLRRSDHRTCRRTRAAGHAGDGQTDQRRDQRRGRRGAAVFRYYGEVIDKIPGELPPTADGSVAMVRGACPSG